MGSAPATAAGCAEHRGSAETPLRGTRHKPPGQRHFGSHRAGRRRRRGHACATPSPGPRDTQTPWCARSVFSHLGLKLLCTHASCPGCSWLMNPSVIRVANRVSLKMRFPPHGGGAGRSFGSLSSPALVWTSPLSSVCGPTRCLAINNCFRGRVVAGRGSGRVTGRCEGHWPQ